MEIKRPNISVYDTLKQLSGSIALEPIQESFTCFAIILVGVKIAFFTYQKMISIQPQYAVLNDRPGDINLLEPLIINNPTINIDQAEPIIINERNRGYLWDLGTQDTVHSYITHIVNEICNWEYYEPFGHLTGY